MRAFVSATGSAGTIGAGDHLKDKFGSLTVAVEALECPTLLNNGFGEHNIQGIGDKHVPLIHNVMATDVVVAISDKATDSMNVLANTPRAVAPLEPRRVDRGPLGNLLVRPVELVQRARGNQAREEAHLGERRPCRHSRHRRRRHVRERAGRAVKRAGRTGSANCPRPRSTASISSGPRRPSLGVQRFRPQPDLQPRLLHLGRAARTPSKSSRLAGTSLLAVPSRHRPHLGRTDRLR